MSNRWISERICVVVKGTTIQCSKFIGCVREYEVTSKASPSKSYNSFVKGCNLILYERGSACKFESYNNSTAEKRYHKKHKLTVESGRSHMSTS